MQLLKLKIFRCFLFFIFLFRVFPAHGAVLAHMPIDVKHLPMHWGADQSKLNRKTHMVELRGNAYLMRDNEIVHADEIDLSLEDDKVYARGRVHYQYFDYDVRADEIFLDLRNKTGNVKNGDLSNGRFALRGAFMEQIGEKRYLVKDYDYSTCFDCPNSWEITGSQVDFTIEGYAFMKDFLIKVKDASLFWLPYMVVPIKSKRQSGLLFPRFGVSQTAGFFFVEPGYLALNDWSDTTLGLGTYSKRGTRVEWEGRYVLTQRSNGIFNFYWTQDPTLSTATQSFPSRYAGKIALTQEMPLGFEAKLRMNEVSDTSYPIIYFEDIDGRNEASLSSDLFFSRNDPQMSTVVSFRRIRNLMYFDSNQNFINGFDTGTVQEFPRVVVNTNDQFLLGSKIASGIEARFNRFARAGGPFDYSVNNGVPIQTIREANRFTLIPELYTTLNPWPWLSVTPSAQYRSYFYNFDGVYSDLARGYLLTQLELSLQLEKVIPTDDPSVTYKHIIRPYLQYSKIPSIQEPLQHPFINQVENQGAGQYFDNSDVIPLGTQQNLDTYFTPLGESLTYGLTTQWFRKERDDKGDVKKMQRRVELGFYQTFDIREAKMAVPAGQSDNRVILSPFFSHFNYSSDKFNAGVEYTYYSFLNRYNTSALLVPYPNAHRLSGGFTWNIESGIHNGIMNFQRTLGLYYSFAKLTAKVSSLSADIHYSINDYIMPQVSFVYNLVTGPQAWLSETRLVTSRFGVTLQHPSRCWRLDLALTQSVDLGEGFSPTVLFAFNLSGDSFGAMDDKLHN